MNQTTVYDYIIIGSGFGGSVAAMRLAEKGYTVLVVEKGKKYETTDFPKSDWNIRKYLWAPLLKCFGILKLTFFKEVFVLSGVGVGGGSLVYANTHMVPPDEFFDNPAWASFNNWKLELQKYYALAKFMLGSVKVSNFNKEDHYLRDVARDMNMEHSWSGVNVGIYYGDTQNPTDPYFNGEGPPRTGCTQCAGCMVGCRHNAKNTLDKNYLHFAQKFGAHILPEHLADKIEHINGIYHIHLRPATSWWGKAPTPLVKAKGMVVAGGVLGTLHLLLKQKHSYKTLPNLSDQLGHNFRTNSEMLCGVTLAREKLNHGIAISSVFNPDPKTHIEIVKFPDGSGMMGKLGTVAIPNGPAYLRTLKLLASAFTRPLQFFRVITNFKFASNSIIFLVMQSLDNAMTMTWKRGGIKLDNKGMDKVPAFVPVGQEVMERYAEKVGGIPQNAITEITMNMATTAHVLGGCPMSDTPQHGVVSPNFQVHNYPNMYILDGSIIPCNLGVNPSLTITALSEYAMAQIPHKEGTKRTPIGFSHIEQMPKK